MPEKKQKKNTPFKEVLKRLTYNKAAMISLAVLIVIALIAIFAEFIAPYGYEEMIDVAFKKPCKEYPFGTDHLGRDVLSRIIYGSRYSLSLGVSAMFLSLIVGAVFGAIAGYYGGTVDIIMMRVFDIIQAVPNILLSMALCVAFGNGFGNTILALGISGIATNARLVRGSILNVRKMEYIDAAITVNCTDAQIIASHVLPNAFAPLIVNCTMGIGSTIMSASSLSFLGLGVQAPLPEWGAMLSGGRDFIRNCPYLTIIPGLCILVVLLALNLLGDGLRDALDPKLKK